MFGASFLPFAWELCVEWKELAVVTVEPTVNCIQTCGNILKVWGQTTHAPKAPRIRCPGHLRGRVWEAYLLPSQRVWEASCLFPQGFSGKSLSSSSRTIARARTVSTELLVFLLVFFPHFFVSVPCAR